MGSITPKGIPVGRVGGVMEKPERFSLALEVKPFADFSRLEEVFDNLIQNAIKFSDGAPMIRISTRALDGGGALINQSIHAIDLLQWFMGPVESVQAFTGTIGHKRIEVEDTGIGIAPEDQTHVFEKFYRAVSDEVQTIAGTGLGLAIAREVARLHGGDIRLESQPQVGSTFVVELPRPAEG